MSVIQRFVLLAIEKHSTAMHQNLSGASESEYDAVVGTMGIGGANNMVKASALSSTSPYLLKIVAWLLLVMASNSPTSPVAETGGDASSECLEVDIPIEYVIFVRRFAMIATDFLGYASGLSTMRENRNADESTVHMLSREDSKGVSMNDISTPTTFDNTTDAAIDVITICMLLLSNSTLGKHYDTTGSPSKTVKNSSVSNPSGLPPALSDTIGHTYSMAIQEEVLYRIQMELFPSLERDRIVSLLLFSKLKGQFNYLLRPYASLALPSAYYASSTGGMLSTVASEAVLDPPPSDFGRTETSIAANISGLVSNIQEPVSSASKPISSHLNIGNNIEKLLEEENGISCDSPKQFDMLKEGVEALVIKGSSGNTGKNSASSVGAATSSAIRPGRVAQKSQSISTTNTTGAPLSARRGANVTNGASLNQELNISGQKMSNGRQRDQTSVTGGGDDFKKSVKAANGGALDDMPSTAAYCPSWADGSSGTVSTDVGDADGVSTVVVDRPNISDASVHACVGGCKETKGANAPVVPHKSSSCPRQRTSSTGVSVYATQLNKAKSTSRSVELRGSTGIVESSFSTKSNVVTAMSSMVLDSAGNKSGGGMENAKPRPRPRSEQMKPDKVGEERDPLAVSLTAPPSPGIVHPTELDKSKLRSLKSSGTFRRRTASNASNDSASPGRSSLNKTSPTRLSAGFGNGFRSDSDSDVDSPKKDTSLMSYGGHSLEITSDSDDSTDFTHPILHAGGSGRVLPDSNKRVFSRDSNAFFEDLSFNASSTNPCTPPRSNGAAVSLGVTQTPTPVGQYLESGERVQSYSSQPRSILKLNDNLGNSTTAKRPSRRTLTGNREEEVFDKDCNHPIESFDSRLNKNNSKATPANTSKDMQKTLSFASGSAVVDYSDMNIQGPTNLGKVQNSPREPAGPGLSVSVKNSSLPHKPMNFPSQNSPVRGHTTNNTDTHCSSGSGVSRNHHCTNNEFDGNNGYSPSASQTNGRRVGRQGDSRQLYCNPNSKSGKSGNESSVLDEEMEIELPHGRCVFSENAPLTSSLKGGKGGVQHSPRNSLEKMNGLSGAESENMSLGGTGGAGGRVQHSPRGKGSSACRDGNVKNGGKVQHSPRRPMPEWNADTGVASLVNMDESVTRRHVKPPGVSVTSRKRAAVSPDAEVNSDSVPHPDNPTASTANADLEYVRREDLTPLGSNAKQDFNKILSSIETADWPEIFHTVTKLRSLSAFHADILISSGAATMRTLIKGLLKQVAALRSQVAKNSILCISDMFLDLQKQLDGEVMNIASGLIKRLTDSSGFVSESCEAALMSMIEHATPNKVLAAFLFNSDSKSAQTRGKVALFLCRLIECRGHDFKNLRDLDSLFQRLSKLLGDNTPEARAAGREIVKIVIQNRIISNKDLSAYISMDSIEKALKEPTNATLHGTGGLHSAGRSIRSASPAKAAFTPKGNMRRLSNNVGAGVGTGTDTDMISESHAFSPHPPVETRNAVDGGGPTTSCKPSKQSPKNKQSTGKIMDRNPELLGLEELFQAISTTKQWMQRIEKLSELANLIAKYADALADIFKLDIAMDHLYTALQDGSIKVCMHALACIEDVVKRAPVAVTSTGASQKQFLIAIVTAASSAQT